MARSLPPLTNREKLAYGLGDSAANFIFQTQITFLLFFYTNVFGIAAGTAGTIILLSRVLDAFNDPIVGALADRTATRWGHYRPWVLCTAIPLAAALVLCYTTPPLSSGGKLIWAIVTYNVLMTVYAANNVPYSALSGVMTADSLERTKLASWRFICAMAAAMLVNTFTNNLVLYLGNGDAKLGYPRTMMLWGLMAVVLFGITFAFTKERIFPDPKQFSSVRQDLSDLAHNGPWMALFVLGVLIHIQLAMRSGALLYYFNCYSQFKNLFSWVDNFGLFNGVGLVFTMVGVGLAKPLVIRFGKKVAFRACLCLSSILLAGFALVPRDAFFELLTLQVLLQLVFGPTIPILWSMMADVADFSEWTSRRRSTGLAFASIIFGLKLGLGVGAWFNGQLLERLQYSATAAVSTSSLLAIRLMISVLPAAVLMIAVTVLAGYRLDDVLMKQIEDDLHARRVATGLAADIV